MSRPCDLLVWDSRMEPADGWDWPQTVNSVCEICGRETPDWRMFDFEALICADCEREVYGSCGQREDAG
mgnify:FL=1